MLAGWMTRAGFSAEPLRWFCGADGSVVVEQEARWVDPVSGAERGSARVASQFTVQNAVVACYQRHDSLDRALAEAWLTRDAEVTHRQMRRCPAARRWGRGLAAAHAWRALGRPPAARGGDPFLGAAAGR